MFIFSESFPFHIELKLGHPKDQMDGQSSHLAGGKVSILATSE